MLQLPISDRTLGRVLREQAKRCPAKPFLLFEGESYTYREAELLTTRLAAGLRGAGVRKGDNVAIQMGNSPEMLWTLFALAWIGAVAVPLNTAAKGDLLTYFVEHSRAPFVIVDSSLLPIMLEATESLPTVTKYIVHADATDSPAESALAARRTDRPLTPLGSLFDASHALEDDIQPDFSDLQLIMYTSGTTGRSKGVMCTHAQEQTGGLFMADQMGYVESDVLYTCLPLFHVNALRVTVNAALWAGATVAMSRRFSASKFWSEIRESGATQFNALGAIANIILRQPPSALDREHHVRLCNIVPALPSAVADEFEQRFGLIVTSMYGSTEFCCPMFASPGTPRDKGPTCGRVVEPFEVRVVDERDFEVPHGQAGEWIIRVRRTMARVSGLFPHAG